MKQSPSNENRYDSIAALSISFFALSDNMRKIPRGNGSPRIPPGNLHLPPAANFYVYGTREYKSGGIDDGPGIDLTLMPPRLTHDEDTIGLPFDTGKPTCSINLLCQRDGILQKYQVMVISKDQCIGPNEFERLIARNKRLIQTDTQFFKAIKEIYEKKMYGIWRSMFSLKTLREIRLISVSFDFRSRWLCISDQD